MLLFRNEAKRLPERGFMRSGEFSFGDGVKSKYAEP